MKAGAPFMPYPEVLDPGEPYQCLDDEHSRVDLTDRVIWTPHRGDIDAATCRIHEQAHVAWSPEMRVEMLDKLSLEFPFAAHRPKLPHGSCACDACAEGDPLRHMKLVAWTLSCCEDARIAVGLREVGLPPRESEAFHARYTEAAQGVGVACEEQGQRWFALAAAVAVGVDNPERARLCLGGSNEPLEALLGEVYAILRRHHRPGRPPHPDALMETARLVLSRKLQWLREDEAPQSPLVGSLFSDGEVAGVLKGKRKEKGGRGRVGDNPGKGVLKGRRPDFSGWFDKCGTVVMKTPPLTLEIPNATVMTKPRNTEEGTVIRHVHRYYMDGAIFRKRGRRVNVGRAGAILIDRSGSMRWDMDQLLELIDTVPCGTVALYSGRCDDGDLLIVSDKGRRMTDDAIQAAVNEMGGNNVIDMPCLEWLSKQKGPRVWFSDGGASGRRDQSHEGMGDACKAFCAKNGIVLTHDHDKAVLVLKEKL